MHMRAFFVVAIGSLAGVALAAPGQSICSPRAHPTSNDHQPGSDSPYSDSGSYHSGSDDHHSGSGGHHPSPSYSDNGPSAEPTSTRCYTKMATTSALWQTTTKWSTHHTPCTSTVTVTVSTTSTPSQSTTTETTITTTTSVGPTDLSTATETSTIVSTETTVTTTTSTSTTTATSTIGGASTIPAPVGFIAIQTSLPGATYSGSDGDSPAQPPIVKRSSGKARSVSVDLKVDTGATNNGPGLCPNQDRHPQGVQCHKWQPSPSGCSTATATTTTTVTAPTPPVTTVTETSTATTTSIPSATTTETTTTITTTTETSTSTTTSVSTTTTTETTITTTVYAACATNNFADLVNGQGINNVIPYANDGVYDLIDSADVNTAYDCCVAAFMDANPAEIFFSIPGSNTCYIGAENAGSVCTQASGTCYTSTQDGISATVGNGPCGEIIA